MNSDSSSFVFRVLTLLMLVTMMLLPLFLITGTGCFYL